MSEFDLFFKGVLKKVNKIIAEKHKKYPMLELEKIRIFFLTWTKHHLSQGGNLKKALYLTMVTFETACNLAMEQINGKSS